MEAEALWGKWLKEKITKSFCQSPFKNDTKNWDKIECELIIPFQKVLHVPRLLGKFENRIILYWAIDWEKSQSNLKWSVYSSNTLTQFQCWKSVHQSFYLSEFLSVKKSKIDFWKGNRL